MPSRVYIYPAGRAGMAFYSYKLANALSNEGLEVTLFVDDSYEFDELPCRFRKIKALSSRNDTTKYSGTRTGRIANVLIAHIYNWFTLFRYVLADRPEILHVQPQFYLLDWFPLTVLTHMSSRLVLTAHDVLPHKFYRREFRALELAMLGYIYRLADTLIVHSEANLCQMIESFGIDRRRIVVISHGEYSLSGISDKMTKRYARNLLNIDASDKVVLFFGFIRKVKGLIILLKAFDRVVESFPDTTLVVAGSAIQGESFDEYRRMIKGMRNGKQVKCFLRYIGHHEIPTFFTAADVVVLPYLSFHSQSGVGHLAQAFAKPVIATSVGGLPELVEDKRTGIIIPPGDPDQLAQAMRALLGNGKLRREMGRRAWETAKEKFSWEKIAKATIQKAYAC